MQIAQITSKRIADGELFFAEHVEPLVRMGEILSGKPNDTSLVVPCDFFIAPLVFESKQAALFLEKRRFAIPAMPGTMPISGMSAPVTPAGAVALALAELLAGWTMAHVVNPDLPASGVVASGSLDMRSANACFGSPEAILQDVTTVEAARRLYGMPVVAATGYVDAKRPGLEAVYQKMLPLASGAFGPGFLLSDPGLLSAGQDYSPVQHLLDVEIEQAVARYFHPLDTSPESIAVELIDAAAHNASAGFADTDHTAAHFRAAQWFPRWFDRSPWEGPDTERASESRMLDRIQEYCRNAIDTYLPPDIDAARSRELTAILRAVERSLHLASTPLIPATH